MRKEYELAESDYTYLCKACRPVMCIQVGSIPHRSQQANANDAWKHLGRKLGFDFMTVQPIEGKSDRWFTAEPKPEE